MSLYINGRQRERNRTRFTSRTDRIAIQYTIILCANVMQDDVRMKNNSCKKKDNCSPPGRERRGGERGVIL